MSKLEILRSRLAAKRLNDAIGKKLTIVFAEITEPKDDDGYTTAVLTDSDGAVWRATSAAVIDFTHQLIDVMGDEWEPVDVIPTTRTSKRGREYLTLELA